MKTTVLAHPTYFFSIEQASYLLKSDEVLFEVKANHKKQTYRTRMGIYGPNGNLSLNIPVVHNKAHQGYQILDKVKIENHFEWQKRHWRSLEASYRSTPYFEYYEEVLYPLYHKPYNLLLEFNIDCFKAVLSILELDIKLNETDSYQESHHGVIDCRPLVEAKGIREKGYSPYYQIFSDKGHGFIENLSVLDLIFHEGASGAKNYLDGINKLT